MNIIIKYVSRFGHPKGFSNKDLPAVHKVWIVFISIFIFNRKIQVLFGCDNFLRLYF